MVLGTLELVIDDHEPPCWCLEANVGPLQEQMFLSAEPSLQVYRKQV